KRLTAGPFSGLYAPAAGSDPLSEILASAERVEMPPSPPAKKTGSAAAEYPWKATQHARAAAYPDSAHVQHVFSPCYDLVLPASRFRRLAGLVDYKPAAQLHAFVRRLCGADHRQPGDADTGVGQDI